MSTIRVSVRTDGAVARIVLTHPPVNAVDAAMLDELADVLGDYGGALAGARVVVLAGAGRCFCAGHDRAEAHVLSEADAAAAHFRAAVRCIRALEQLPVPSVAAVHGAAIGVGLILAASCSVAVFAEDALLGLPERAVGLAAGTAHAHRLLPPAVARWMALTGARVPAGDLRGALPVVAAGDLDRVVTEVVGDVATTERPLLGVLAGHLQQPSTADVYERELADTLAVIAARTTNDHVRRPLTEDAMSTTESITAVALDDVRWREFPIPGGTPDVRLSHLRVEPDKAFTTVVRFPPGWSRPDTGWYDHIEEVLFLEGEFEMSGIRYGAGDYGWFPAGYEREGSSSPGALALAWFSGPNRWITDPSPVAAAAAHGFVRCSWRDVAPVASPLGAGDGRLLVRSSDRTSWVVDAVPAGETVPSTVELFSLEQCSWARVMPGAPLPEFLGPVFCRVYEA